MHETCPYIIPDELIEIIENAMIDVSLDQNLEGLFEEQFSAVVVIIKKGRYDLSKEFYDYLKESIIASRCYEPKGYGIKRALHARG